MLLHVIQKFSVFDGLFLSWGLKPVNMFDSGGRLLKGGHQYIAHDRQEH